VIPDLDLYRAEDACDILYEWTCASCCGAARLSGRSVARRLLPFFPTEDPLALYKRNVDALHCIEVWRSPRNRCGTWGLSISSIFPSAVRAALRAYWQCLFFECMQLGALRSEARRSIDRYRMNQTQGLETEAVQEQVGAGSERWEEAEVLSDRTTASLAYLERLRHPKDVPQSLRNTRLAAKPKLRGYMCFPEWPGRYRRRSIPGSAWVTKSARARGANSPARKEGSSGHSRKALATSRCLGSSGGDRRPAVLRSRRYSWPHRRGSSQLVGLAETLPRRLRLRPRKTKLKIRKRFFPLGLTRLTLGADYDPQAGEWWCAASPAQTPRACPAL